MLSRFFSRLQQLLHPFASIAQSLAIIAELYELELSERRPPIRRVTETPSRHDTEVSYSGVEDKRDIFADADPEWE